MTLPLVPVGPGSVADDPLPSVLDGQSLGRVEQHVGHRYEDGRYPDPHHDEDRPLPAHSRSEGVHDGHVSEGVGKRWVELVRVEGGGMVRIIIWFYVEFFCAGTVRMVSNLEDLAERSLLLRVNTLFKHRL